MQQLQMLQRQQKETADKGMVEYFILVTPVCFGVLNASALRRSVELAAFTSLVQRETNLQNLQAMLTTKLNNTI